MKVKTKLFRVLAQINKKIMPRYSKRDLNKLKKLDKLLIAYRYYITKNALDD